jgi:glutamate--cysteine ligase
MVLTAGAKSQNTRLVLDSLRGSELPDVAGLEAHANTLRPPVAARGHLEIDVADGHWQVAVSVTAALLDAYAALSRQGVARDLRDAVVDFTERYVMRGRCPADDVRTATSVRR